MIIRASAQCPVVLALRVLDWQIVDGSKPQADQPVLIELPILIAIRAELIPGVVVPFIGKAHRDLVSLERISGNWRYSGSTPPTIDGMRCSLA